MRNRLLYAFFGVLATLVGVAAGHFVASLLNPDSSPVLAVGSQVIDLTPTPMKEWAIRQFGSNDKAILIGSVMAGVLVLAAVAGLLARRRFALGAGLQVVLVGVAAFTALTRPAVEAVDVIPVDRHAGRRRRVAVAALPAARVEPVAARPPRPTSDASGPTRRGVVLTAGVLTVAAVALGSAGRFIGRARSKITDIAFPKPADPAPAFPKGIEGEYPGITAVPHLRRRLLPRGHPPRRPDRRHRHAGA